MDPLSLGDQAFISLAPVDVAIAVYPPEMCIITHQRVFAGMASGSLV